MVRDKAQKKTSPVVWLLLAAVGVGAWVATSSDDAPAKSAKKTFTKKKTGADDQYTEQDYKAHFAPVKEAARNTFVPLVVKAHGGGAVAENGIPAGFFSGDGSWNFGGTVEVNGKASALIENSTTGESVFLHQGESYLGAKIKKVTQTAMVIEGVNGLTASLKVGDVSLPNGSAALKSSGVLKGPIGPARIGQLNIQPLPQATPNGGQANMGRVPDDGLSQVPANQGGQ